MTKRIDGIGKPTAESLYYKTGISSKGKLESGKTREEIALDRQAAGNRGWGGTAKQTRTPSGVKVTFEEDQDAILKFLGVRDIGDKVNKEPGEALFYSFWDGCKIISIPGSYAIKETPFLDGIWYYLWVADYVPNKTSGFNPMKDFDIRELGKDGESVQCPERVSDDGILLLNEDVIAEINYHRINYPLRKS